MLRPKLNRIWASNSSTMRRDPGDAKYIQGWISEIPTFQVLNYLQYKIDVTLLALAERGIFEWGSDIQYGLNSLVWDETNKTVYISTVGSPNKTLAPSANPTQWVASSIQVSRASYDEVVSAINSHIADVTSNPHGLTANMIGAYSKNEIDNIVAQYQAIVKSHVDDKNNPHQVTASQAGAVPSTGGTYSGDVIFAAGIFFDANKVNTITKTGGLFLKNGAGQIGIDDTGVGKVGSGSSLSTIVTEDAYPGLKAAQEPSYTAPIPTYALDLIGSININVGVGSVDDPSPSFNAAAGNCYFYNPTTAKTLVSDKDINLSGRFTMAVDLMSPDPRSSTSTATNIKIGTEEIHLLGLDNGTYSVETSTGNYAPTLLTGPVATWYRFAAVFDGTNIIAYVNGVEVARAAATVGTPTSNKAIINFFAKTTTLRRWNIRNFRLWDSALTSKQVSTL